VRRRAWGSIGVVAGLLVVAAGVHVGLGPARAVAASCAGQPATMIGTAKKDRLVGTPGNDVIVGLGGNDMIDGAGGDDVLCGDAGVDTISGGDGNDQIFAGDNGTVPLFESEPEPRGDTVRPGPGDDLVDVGTNTVGVDDFGYPEDLLDLSGSATGVQLDLVAGTVTGEGSDVIVLPTDVPAGGNALEVQGTSYADVLRGSEGADLFVSGEGDDVVEGRGGDDLLLDNYEDEGAGSVDSFDGGPGDDSLDGGGGADTLLGGPGRDDVQDTGGGLALMDGGPGHDRLWAYLSSDTGSITGGSGRDVFSFNTEYLGGRRRPVGGIVDLAAGALTVRRADVPPWRAALTDVSVVEPPSYGRWRFVGSDEPEVLRGSSARLVADGGGGDDRLVGSTKDDVLVGGSGRDEVDGRAGEDRCRAERTRHCESR